MRAKVKHSTDGNLSKLALEDIIESCECAFGLARQELSRAIEKTHSPDYSVNANTTNMDAIQRAAYQIAKAGKNLDALYRARDRDIKVFHDSECDYCFGDGKTDNHNPCVMCDGTGLSYDARNKTE